MTTREILTLQFGHYSNFIGAHWWNLQETNFTYDPASPSEINHDVLYREGQNMQGKVTFTPRLLLADLKGTLGYMSERGALYEVDKPQDEPLWDKDKLEITSSEPSPRTPFVRSLTEPKTVSPSSTFNFEEDVKSWVDYLLPSFHPRTVSVIREYVHGCTERPFDVFTYGRNFWHAGKFSEDFADRIRNYVEECDLNQGFQVLVDSADGFAGLGTACVQHLRDEYGRSILAFPCLDYGGNAVSAADLVKIVNTGLCWRGLGEHASLFSPLSCGQAGWPFAADARCFEHFTYDPKLRYHTGAIIATALDTLTLRYRTKRYPCANLSDLCADLNKLGRTAAAASISLPFPMRSGADLIDLLDDIKDGGCPWTSLTPSCDIGQARSMQSVTLRGVPEDRVKQPVHKAKKQLANPLYRCASVHEAMTMYLSSVCQTSATYISTVETPLKIDLPYPKIFNGNVTQNGSISEWPVGTGVTSIATMAGLHSGPNMTTMFGSLLSQIERINMKKFHVFADSGLEEDEFTECVQALASLKETYEDCYI